MTDFYRKVNKFSQKFAKCDPCLRAELNCEKQNLALFTASISDDLSLSSPIKNSHNNNIACRTSSTFSRFFRGGGRQGGEAKNKTKQRLPLSCLSRPSRSHRACLRSLEKPEEIAPVLQATKTGNGAAKALLHIHGQLVE